jgi:anti-sigma factor RsiW
MPDDDSDLVALIDNELDDSRRTALLARLAADDGLRQRYEEFRQTGAPLAASLDELLTQLRSRACAPRFPLRNPCAGRQGAFPESPFGTLRRA